MQFERTTQEPYLTSDLGDIEMLKRFILFGLLLTAATAARAGILVAFDPAASSGNTWVYDVSLAPGDNMNTGDFFTVFDFKGLQKNGAQFVPDATNAGGRIFDTVIQGQGETPLTTKPIDLANIDNVTVQLKSGAEIMPTGAALFPIGTLTLASNLGVQQSQP